MPFLCQVALSSEPITQLIKDENPTSTLADFSALKRAAELLVTKSARDSAPLSSPNPSDGCDSPDMDTSVDLSAGGSPAEGEEDEDENPCTSSAPLDCEEPSEASKLQKSTNITIVDQSCQDENPCGPMVSPTPLSPPAPTSSSSALPPSPSRQKRPRRSTRRSDHDLSSGLFEPVGVRRVSLSSSSPSSPFPSSLGPITITTGGCVETTGRRRSRKPSDVLSGLFEPEYRAVTPSQLSPTRVGTSSLDSPSDLTSSFKTLMQ